MNGGKEPEAMPPRVSPVVLLSLTMVIVLSCALTAGAAPNDMTMPGGPTPERGSDQGEGTVPDQAVQPNEAVQPDNGAGQENVVPDGGAALDESAAPDDVVIPDVPEEDAATQEDVASDEHAATEENAASEEATPQEDATPEEEATPEEPPEEQPAPQESAGAVDPGEAGDELDAMLSDAEAADGEFKNARFEEKRLDKEVAKTRSDLTSAENNLGDAQDNLDHRASQIYKQDRGDFLGVLLKSKNFSQFANLLGSWIQLLKQDQDEVEKWRDSQRELEQTSGELQAQLDSWEETRKEAANKKEEAQSRVNQAQEFFKALDNEAQKEIEQQRASESELALDHAQKVIQEAAQEKPIEDAGNQDKTAQDQPASQAAEAEKPERTPEEEQNRKVEVAQAIADTIVEWKPAVQQAREPADTNGDKAADAEKPVAVDEGANENPNQNPAAGELADAAQKQAEAQQKAGLAAEQADKEKQAQEEANQRAAEADKAKLAAQQAPAADQQTAQTAAEEAQRQAGLAADQAAQAKKAAEDLATQAKEKLSDAEGLASDAQMAAQKAAANNPLAPKPGATGIKPNGTPGTGSGVLGEAKSWLGVPYDYTHMAGETRKAVDCSAFTAAVFRKFGKMLPDSPGAQFGMGTPVLGPAKAGDLVFFSEDGSGAPTHVGIANGDGTLTHASNFTGEVSVTPIDYIPGYLGARRLL
jgi:cell wall-associated NlpC family hydrolase